MTPRGDCVVEKIAGCNRLLLPALVVILCVHHLRFEAQDPVLETETMQLPECVEQPLNVH